ncbi:Phasin protein [Rhizobiales bacterium GAS191]|nr:Phasin protein [Rhizobiales bacterium GAS113]SEE75503.1 Phasin protein [Rhizobiales bacterium GAS191]
MFAQYEDFQKYGERGRDAALKRFCMASKGFQAIAGEVADFSKGQFGAGSAAFEKLVEVRTFDKAVEVQAEYAKQAFEGFVTHSTKVGQIVSNLAKETMKPAETAIAQATPVVPKVSK